MKLYMLCFAVLIFHLNVCFGQSSQSEKLIVITQVKQLKDNLLTNVTRDPMSIAVLPFESTEGRSEARGLGEAAAILLNQTLTKESDITIIERNKLKDVLDEMSLSLSGMTSEEIKVGELLKADYLIAGAVADLNSRFLIAARLVEIKSGRVISSSSIEIPAGHFMAVSQGLVQVKRYPITASFRSMIIPGWGQFYNEKSGKGSFILGSELLLAGGAVSSYILYKQSADAYERTSDRELAQDKYDEMDMYSMVNWGCLGAMGVVWLYGMIDAYFDARSQIKEYKGNRLVNHSNSKIYAYPLIDTHKIGLSMQYNF